MKTGKISIITLAVLCAVILMQSCSAIAGTTTEEAKQAALLRTITLANSLMDEMKSIPEFSHAVKVSMLSTDFQAKIEDMLESQMASTGSPFDPKDLAGAEISLSIESDGTIRLELKRSNGENNVWIKAASQPTK